MKCELCNREFETLRSLGLHLSHSHSNIDFKEYYDKYFKQENEGICPVCGNRCMFTKFNRGYKLHCSKDCATKDKNTLIKRKETCNLKNLGVENPFQQKYVQEKAIHNSHTAEAEIKRQQTCLEKYGNKYHIASEEIRKKTLNTLKERYNVRNAYSIPEIHTKAIQNSLNYHDDNGNDSSWEALLEKALIDKNINYNKHYNKDPRYPYQCDFYLIDTDTFIEINGFWMHGGHYFNKYNKEDLEKLQVWKNKKSERLYETAIDVWTKSDLLKRKIAKNNKLNYIVLWTLDDINEYIKTL